MYIKEPMIFQIAQRTWCINEYGMDSMFLLEGDERALLIDTGIGVLNLPSYIKRYTDKPLMVALTHGHLDHAGGNSWFEDVYLHEEDFEMAKNNTRQDRAGYVCDMMAKSEGLYNLSEESVIDGPFDTRLHPLKEGDVIRLGNRDVVVYETPGHTIGSICFLDVKERIFYSGDACNVNTLLICSREAHCDKGTMSALLASARKIEGLHPFYDRNYNGHIGYGCNITSMDPMPECLTRDCIELCQNLLSGKEKGVSDDPKDENVMIAKNHTMQIVYAKEQLR